MPNGILIADDSATARKAICAYLNQRNFEVRGEAIDGVDALEKATELRAWMTRLAASHDRW
jgi:chemotaxis response regulator CheB